QRYESLCSMGLLGGMVFALGGWRRTGVASGILTWCGTLLCFAFALNAKQVGVVFPFLVLIGDLTARPALTPRAILLHRWPLYTALAVMLAGYLIGFALNDLFTPAASDAGLAASAGFN